MSRWYILQKGRPYGPVTTDSIVADLRARRLNRQDLIFSENDTSWREVGSFSVFKEAILEQESLSPIKGALDEWVLLVRNADGSGYRQKGPFQRTEILSMIQSGEIAFTDYVWRKGLKEWYKILALTEFHKPLSVAHLTSSPTEAKDLTEVTIKLPLPHDEPVPSEANDMQVQQKQEQQKLSFKIKSELEPKISPADRHVRPGRKKLAKTPEPVAMRVNLVKYYAQLTPLKKMAFVSVSTLALGALLFLITYFSSYRDRHKQYLQAPTVSYVAPTPMTPNSNSPKATANAIESSESVALPIETPAKEDKKDILADKSNEKNNTQDDLRVAPTTLQVSKEGDGTAAPRLIIKTDASRHYPVVVSLNSEAGDVLYLRSFLRKLRLYKMEERNLDLGALKLLPGYYDVTVEVENLKQTLKLSYATLTTADFSKKIKRHRKQIFMYHNDERYSFIKTAGRLEKEAYVLVQNIDNTSNMSSWSQAYRSWRRNFDRIHNPILKQISPKNRTNYVHASKWLSLKNLRSKIDNMARDINKLKGRGAQLTSREVKAVAQEITRLKEQMFLESLQRK